MKTEAVMISILSFFNDDQLVKKPFGLLYFIQFFPLHRTLTLYINLLSERQVERDHFVTTT